MNLGRHKKTEQEHDCDFCDESFATRDLLVDHFAEVHHKENVINNINECEGAENDAEMMENEYESTEPVQVFHNDKTDSNMVQTELRIKQENGSHIDGTVQVKREVNV